MIWATSASQGSRAETAKGPAGVQLRLVRRPIHPNATADPERQKRRRFSHVHKPERDRRRDSPFGFALAAVFAPASQPAHNRHSHLRDRLLPPNVGKVL